VEQNLFITLNTEFIVVLNVAQHRTTINLIRGIHILIYVNIVGFNLQQVIEMVFVGNVSGN